MTIRHVIMVTGVAAAMVGCGADGTDVAGGARDGFFGTIPPVEAPNIEVVSGSETHDDGEMAAHDDEEMAAHDDGEMAAHDDGEMAAHDDGEMAAHDDEEMAAHDDEEMAAHDDEEMAGESGIVVEVEMVDFGYVLDRDAVPMGEPITFRFTNVGEIEHEAMFGSLHQQEEFEAAGDHGADGGHGAESHHGDVAALTLDPQADGELVLTFDAPGEVIIGCHLPGHWDAGMLTSLFVTA